MKIKQVVNNAKWIIVCKIIQSVIQLLIGMLCARYLGPKNYGLINYAASIVAFALPIVRLGFNATLVHELIETPEKEGRVIGTSVLMSIISSFACIFFISGFLSVVNRGEKVVIAVGILYSLSLIFSAMELIQYWFQYKLLSKYSSIVMLVAYIFVSLYKVFLLAASKSIYWFAVVYSLDYGIISICLFVIYFKKGGQRFSFSFSMAKRLINKSKHYIFSALMVVVIQNTDHIMITTMMGEKQNGYYSAAITCAAAIQFVYIAIIDSFRPLILSSKKENEEEYENNVSSLFCIISYLCLAQSLIFTVFAKLIVTILYGAEYYASVSILQILVWYITFSLMGMVRNVWILAEGKQKLLWVINISGAIFNVVLNAVLIPLFGPHGAAFASLMTQFFTNFVLGFIIKPMRKNNELMLKGLNPKFLVNEIKKYFKILTAKE